MEMEPTKLKAKTMTSKLKCASSLFTCFSSSRKNRPANDDVSVGGRGGNGGIDVVGKKYDKKAGRSVNFDEEAKRNMDRPQSPSRLSDMASVCSINSGRSSVYFEATEGDQNDWQNNMDADNSFHSIGSFETLQIDGQFFFSARDDPTLTNDDYQLSTKDALEGVHLYPPIPTTEPDPPPRSRISVSNMQTLLHTYQHVPTSLDEKFQEEEEIKNAEKAGLALEHQAERLLLMGEKKSMSTADLGESTILLLEELKMPKVRVREKGFPGELTEKELEAVKHLRSELQTRDPVYKQIISGFSSVEKEAYALCRFLRARKFDVEKVFEMLDEAKDAWTEAKRGDFYPDLEKSMGVPRSVFLSQYPAVMAGNARNGCPVMYLKAGSIQPEGIKCVVSIDKVDRFFWNDIMYVLTSKLKDGRQNSNFVRCENITVYDLKGVSRGQFNSDTFEMIKVGNKVMASFPETLHCLVLINAPSWFGLVWSVVKKLIDARTASKIEVFTNAKAGLDRMNELIDNSQIPSDYGGAGPSLAESASGVSSENPGKRNKMVAISHLLSLSKKQTEKEYNFELESGKRMTLNVYTRCKTGCAATLYRGGASVVMTEVDVVGNTDDEPYHRTIGALEGPGCFTVKLKSNSLPGNYLILGTASSSN